MPGRKKRYCRRCGGEVISIYLMTQQNPIRESWRHTCRSCGIIEAADVLTEKPQGSP